MNKEEIALEVLKLTYRHDQKTIDLINKSQELFNWIISISELNEGMKKKKSVTSGVV